MRQLHRYISINILLLEVCILFYIFQMDELRQKNRSLRHQLNLANQEREKQSMDREKALTKLEKARTDQMRLVNEMEILRKENNILQKKLDQNDHQVVCFLLLHNILYAYL